jgi:hypothetical protein
MMCRIRLCLKELRQQGHFNKVHFRKITVFFRIPGIEGSRIREKLEKRANPQIFSATEREEDLIFFIYYVNG